MSMTDWQIRVVMERNELKSKYESLLRFTQTQSFERMESYDSFLLIQQSESMARYLHFLDARIARFEEQE